MIDHQAAARAGVDPPKDHDQPPKYQPQLGPPPRLDMDPQRFDVACSWNFDTPRFSWGHWRVTCHDCSTTLVADTKAELDRLAREHTA